MTKLWGVSAALIFFFVSCESNRIAGTTDETDTSISGKVSYASGTSASQAMVSIFKDTATTPLAKVAADNAGNYKFSKLNSGSYSVWAEGNDSIVAYADSIYVPMQKQVVQNLTLEKSGSVTAFIKLQPDHHPSSVTVNALGTQRYGNVNAAAAFTVGGLAPSEYTLRLVTTYPNYTPTFKTVIVESGINDTLKDTIELIYTGIPVVTGLKATFDTTAGIITFSWDKTTYWDFQEYLIFRDLYGAPNLSTQAIASRKEPLFKDSLFKNGYFLPTDTGSLHLKYRVSIRSDAGSVGVAYRDADVWVVPPSLLTMRFSSAFRDSINGLLDTVVIFGRYSSPVGTLVKSVQWKDLGTGAVVSSKEYTPQIATAYDTVRWVPKAKGICRLECSVVDSRGVVWKDTVSRYIGSAPVITVQPKDTSVIQDSYVRWVVKATGDAPIVYRWLKISADTVSFDSVLIFSKVQVSDTGSYYCRVSNPYGTTTSAPLHLSLKSKPRIVSGPFDTNALFGDTVRLSVNVTSEVPFSYAWFKRNSLTGEKTPLPGQTGPIFIIAGAQIADNGNYFCVVNSQNGADTSRLAHIAISELPPMVVAAWTFDSISGTTYYDVSGHNNHLITSTLGLGWTLGIKRYGLACTGGGYEMVASNTRTAFNRTRFSFECWYISSVDPKTQITDAASLLNFQSDILIGSRNGYSIYINSSGKVVFGMAKKDSSGYVDAISTTSLSAGQWYHIAATYDSVNLKVYINGILENTVQNYSGGYPAPGADARVGCQRRDPFTVHQFLNGIIDEIRYYNYALPSDSVSAHFKVLGAPFTSDQYTVALWHFDEGAGDSVYDASGNGNHGLIYGAQWKPGKFGLGLSFSGVDSVKVVDKPGLHVQAVTIEAWVYSLGLWGNPRVPHGVIVSKEYGSMASYRLQSMDSVGRVSVVTDNNWGNNVKTSQTLTHTVWHHVAGVAANGYLKVYIDGELAASAPRPISMNYDNSPLLIGAVRNIASECFRGTIDEVRISSIDRFAR